MKHQKGAALIVVLSLLTVSLMVGLSSIQSSQIDERLAGNYKAQSAAQMAAEEAASVGWGAVSDISQFSGTSFTSLEQLQNISWGEFQNSANFDNKAASDTGCLEANCYYRYVKVGGDYYIVAMGGVDDGGVSVSEPVIVFLEYDPVGLILGAEAALTCVGFDCKFFAKTKPTVIDGRDYKADVDTTGNIKDEDINPGGKDKAAYVVLDGDVELGSATVRGDKVFNRELYAGYDGLSPEWDGEDGAEVRIKNEIDNMIELGKAGDSRVTYWDSESVGEFVMPSSGVVVVNGTDLVTNVSGNFKFTGLIVIKNGSFDLKQGSGGGTTSIVGAVIAQDSIVDMQNGNPSLLYSSEALCQAYAIAGSDCADQGGGAGSNGDFNIKGWK